MGMKWDKNDTGEYCTSASFEDAEGLSLLQI